MYNTNRNNNADKPKRSNLIATLSTPGLAVLIVLGACGTPVAVEAVPTETITVLLSGRDCLIRDIGEVCITRSETTIGVEASGLAPGPH